MNAKNGTSAKSKCSHNLSGKALKAMVERTEKHLQDAEGVDASRLLEHIIGRDLRGKCIQAAAC